MSCDKHPAAASLKAEFDLTLRVRQLDGYREVSVYGLPVSEFNKQVPECQLVAMAEAIYDFVLWRKANPDRITRWGRFHFEQAKLDDDLDVPVPPLTDKGRAAIADVIDAARRDLVNKRLEADRMMRLETARRRRDILGKPVADALQAWKDSVG